MSNDHLRYLELRELNERAWAGEVVFKLAGKQDLSLKKNTGFVKKLKSSFNADQYKQILKDVETLSLEKYLTEIVGPAFEGTLKVSKNDDIMAAVEIINALHQRLNLLFTPSYLSHVVNAIVEKEQLDLAVKQRLLLKLITELSLTGVATSLRQCDSELLSTSALKLASKSPNDFILVPLLKDVLSYQFPKAHALPVMISWLKRYAFLLKEENRTQIPDSCLNTLQQICSMYFDKVVGLLKSLHREKTKLELSNKKAMIRTGRVLEEREQELKELTQVLEALDHGCPTLAELLNKEMPPIDVSVQTKNNESDVIVKASHEEETKGWWEDQRERNFYKKVPNYESVVASEGPKLKKKEYAKLSEGEIVNRFLEKLELSTTEEDIDKLTAELHTFIPSNKATHNRILRFFLEVKKVDNVNLFARFLKINESFFPDLITELIDALDRGFRSQIYGDIINFKNLYFFIELIKFNLIPTHVVFHKIRRLTLNIEGTNNADILLIFYERCGKFLLLESEYQETTREMLALLSKQSKSSRLSVNEKLSLRNMFLIVNSFTATKNKVKATTAEMTPLQDFVSQMLKNVLLDSKLYKQAWLLGKIKFKYSADARDTFVSIYLRPEELGLDKLDMYAKLLKHLGTQGKVLAPLIVDALTEKVIRGLELNDYRQNLARVAQIRFFVALYKNKVLSFRCIIDLLFKIVTWGHPNNLPLPGSTLDIDPYDNYFRIGLCCTLLNNISFSKVEQAGLLTGSTKSLEGFLTFLQYYILTKKKPLPREIHFAVEEVYSKTFISPARDDPSRALSLLQNFNSQSKEPVIEEETIIDDSENDAVEFSSDDDESGMNTEEELRSDDETSDDESHKDASGDITREDEDSDDEDDHEDEDEGLVDELVEDTAEEEEEDHAPWARKIEVTEEDKKFADTIDAGIRDALQESLNLSQSKSRGTFRIPAPSTLAGTQNEAVNNTCGVLPNGSVKFSFLSRKNNVKEMHLPSDNQFVDRVVREQAAQKANRDKIIRLINNME